MPQQQLFDMVLEKALPGNSAILSAKTFDELAQAFKAILGIPSDSKPDTSDYGLKVRGIKARENLNAMARDILDRVHDPADLSDEDAAVLKQYSGRGGLTENSQFEYYTPTPVAEGMWDILKGYGITAGNILDPCTGAGVFPSTKPAGLVVTGTDIDPVGSKIAQLFNPEDSIRTGSFESLVGKTDDNHFDSVIGNVPFGDARGKSIHDDPAYKNEKRIERYFILRALDKTRPGGLACLVVPTNILTNKSDRWNQFRIAVSKKAEFLGAHKLPSKTFRAQGTDTVVDIIVFKKHPSDLIEKIDNIDFKTLQDAKVVWGEFVNGSYWQGEGRQFIHGTYVPKIDGDRWSREVVDGDIDPAALKQKIAVRFDSRIDWDMLDVAPADPPTYVEGDHRIINGRQCEFIGGRWVATIQADSGMALDAKKYGAATLDDLKAILSSPDGALQLTAEQAFAIYKTWPELLSSLHTDAVLFSMSQTDDKFREQAFRGTVIGGLIGRLRTSSDDMERDRLQSMVAAEIERYGHPKGCKWLVLTGESSRAFGMFLSSVDQKGVFSDLLAGTLSEDRTAFDSTNIQSIVEHLYVREGMQNIELEDVKKIYTGKMAIENLGDLASADGIAIAPSGMIMPMGRYASGDVYPKMVELTQVMADEEDSRLKEKWQQQIDTIQSKLKLTPPEDIDLGLQEKWFPKKYLVEFLRANGYPHASFGADAEVEKEDSVTGETITANKFVEDFDNPFGKWIGIEGPGFKNQFLKFLNGDNVAPTGEGAQERREAYTQAIKATTENFNAWMQQHPDMAQVAAVYNRKFNAFIPHEYDDSPLHIEGFSDRIKPHGYQYSAIRRLSEEGGGILADDVGLGKTLSAIALHLYNKQMGRTKKTCIVVPDAVLNNWYHETNKFVTDIDDVLFVGIEARLDKNGKPRQEIVQDEFGNPKINKFTNEVEKQTLLITKKDPDDIWAKMWEIPNTNKSLVVMTSTKFGSIPMRPDTKARYAKKMSDRSLISDKMAKSLSANGVAEDDGGSKKKTYDDDKAGLRAEAKYSDEGTRKKGELPYFEDMGFTNVIIDEAHEYKNSFKSGEKTSDVAYLSVVKSAQRAIDMQLKSAYMKERFGGKGVYPLSATPVTNSPLEIYNVLSLVAPMEEFERFGVYTVDDFVRAFGKIESVDKVMVSGEIKTKDGLVGFKKLDGLRNLFHKYVLYRTADDVGLELPGSDEANEEVDLSEVQGDVYADLREDAKEASKPGSKISMFSIIRNMDRVTTDMDLYTHTMTFYFKLADKEKVDKIVSGLPKTVSRKAKDEEGKTIDVDVDVDVVNKLETKGDTYCLTTFEELEAHVISKLAVVGIDENDVSHPLPPKYAKLVENVRAHLEANGKQVVFTEEKSQHGKLKRILSHHVPLSRDVIAIINADEASGTKLQKISDNYNSGKIKLVIANKKAEVGVNLQKGTTAIHHLTLPWTPASIQQRNGRGVRQGNTSSSVKIYYYLGKNSFDFYRLDLLKRKASWIRDLLTGTDIEADNGNVVSDDDMLDLLADNPEEAKKRRLEKLAQKNTERDERERKRLVNMLQLLGNVTEALSGLGEAKVKRKQDLTTKVENLTETIERLKKKGLAMDDEDPEKKKLAKRINDGKKSLVKAKADLDDLDAAFERERVHLEAQKQQSMNVLTAKGKKGELPFDASVLDHPEKAICSLSGKVYAAGDVYERRTGRGMVIFKLTDAFQSPQKAFTYDVIMGSDRLIETEYIRINGSSKTVILLTDFPDDAIKVSYSEKELALKKLLSEEIRYIDLVGSADIDKQTFFENIADIKIYGKFFVRKGDGFAFQDNYYIENKADIVFPEPTNETYRKNLSEAYLEAAKMKTAYDYVDSTVTGIVATVFGSDWKVTVMQYGTVATETQIREFYAKFVNDFLDDKLGDKVNQASPSEIHSILGGYGFQNDLTVAASALGDNRSDIETIANKCRREQLDTLLDQMAKEKAEADRKAAEAIKQHPNYKEIPEEVKNAFAQLGITVKINSRDVTLQGKYKNIAVAAFSKWFFLDRNAKQGVLYRTKEILKARYGAQFFAGSAGELSNGAYWYIDSKTDLKDIFAIMS